MVNNNNNSNSLLRLDITGYGVVSASSSSSHHHHHPDFMVLVISVSQSKAASWVIYRRLASFQALSSQLPIPYRLQSNLLSVPLLPAIDVLCDIQSSLSNWLDYITTSDTVTSLQVFQEFIITEANLPPIGILQAVFPTQNSNTIEMEMDDMFSSSFADDTEASTTSSEQPEPLQTSSYPPKSTSPKKKLVLEDFKMLKVIGKGSFGKVLQVQKLDTGAIYAMKVLRKENIIKRNQVEHTRTERHVLGYIHHPFVVGMNFAFQDRDKLYFLLDYCAGGELFFHLGKVQRFAESRARFYAAQIILALEYMHSLDIIYRDLKPENVLLDEYGHIKLTDFGLSKEGIQGNFTGAHSFCGTPEYLAPEILNRSGHGAAVDWWSLGALLYEMLTGLPPFYSRDRQELFNKIQQSELTYPRYLSLEARNLLKGLLSRDPTKRLGTGTKDASEIKSHAFFAKIDWEALYDGQLSPPWVPTFDSVLDTSQFDEEFTSMPLISPESRSNNFSSHTNTSNNSNSCLKNSVVRPVKTQKDNVASSSAHLFQGFTYTEESRLTEGKVIFAQK